MRFHDTFCDCEPQARTRRLRYIGRSTLLEHLEHGFKFMGRDSRSLILYGNIDRFTAGMQTDFDAVARTRKLDRIRQQIIKDPIHLGRIHADGGQPTISDQIDADLIAFGHRPIER